jgi:hypothetical protein
VTDALRKSRAAYKRNAGHAKESLAILAAQEQRVKICKGTTRQSLSGRNT